jgi:hypothetical protein
MDVHFQRAVTAGAIVLLSLEAPKDRGSQRSSTPHCHTTLFLGSLVFEANEKWMFGDR